MKLALRFFFLFILFVLSGKVRAQNNWVDLVNQPNANFYDVQKAFNSFYNDYLITHPEVKKEQMKGRLQKEEKENEGEIPGFEQYKRWEWFMSPRVYPTGNYPDPMAPYNEYKRILGVNATARRTRSATWTYIGPDSIPAQMGGEGRVNFIRFDPTNSNIIYVGAPDGGLWKSTNGGTGWTTNTDDLTVLGCSDLAIDPTNHNILYLATGDADGSNGNGGQVYSVGILKSTDGGTTWNPTGLTWTVNQIREVYKVIVDPNNANILIAATNNGIYRTLDGGANWTLVQAGTNFTNVLFKPGDPTTVYAVNNHFYKSTNTGQAWTIITTGAPAQASVARMTIAVTQADANYVYLLAANNTNYGMLGFYRSTDGGTTFSTMNSTFNVLNSTTNGAAGYGQGFYDLVVTASPANKNTVFVGGVNIFGSTDGGSTWSVTADTYGASGVHPDIHGIEFIPGGSSSTFFACTDGGLFETTGLGKVWINLSNGLHIGQAYRIGLSSLDPDFLLTGWQDNGVNRSLKSKWAHVLSGDGMETIISRFNSNTNYSELYYGQIFKSTDGSNTYGITPIVKSGASGVNMNGSWVTPFVEDPVNEGTLYVGKNRVYKSINDGNAWTQLAPISLSGTFPELTSLAVAPSNNNYIYAASPDRFFACTDGTNFTNKTTGLPNAAITYIAVDYNNPSRVYVTVSGYADGNKCFMSTDAGGTWNNISTGLPNVPANCVVCVDNSATNGVYVGTDIGVFYSDNTTGGFIAYSNGLPNVIVNELEIQYGSGKLIAGTFGRGLWQADLYQAPTLKPVVQFTASVLSGCSPLIVNFDNNSLYGVNYQWSFPGGTPATSTATYPQVTYGDSGNFKVTLTVTNVVGNDSLVKTGYIHVLQGPTVNLVAISPLCNGQTTGTTVLNVTGGKLPYHFKWSNGNTTNSLNKLGAGVYAFTVSDANGCSVQRSAVITQPGPLTYQSTVFADNEANGKPNGYIVIKVQGGTQPYSYTWSDAKKQKTDSAYGLTKGSYICTVTDANGCQIVVREIVGTGTGVENVALSNQVTIYPNPVSGTLNISCGIDVSGYVVIYDLIGKQVMRKSISNAKEIHIDTYNLPAGVYGVSLLTDKGTVFRKIEKL